MNLLLLTAFLSFPLIAFSQTKRSMEEVTLRQERSMADVEGRSSQGVYRYYALGETKPYTGVLFANHPNGKLASWQEYVDGVGQGKWINYYDNGNIEEEGEYHQNRVEGYIKKYYRNGNLRAVGQYKDWRVMIGPWKYYNEDGTFKKTKDYGDKGSIAEVQAYYDSGEISKQWYEAILKKNGFTKSN